MRSPVTMPMLVVVRKYSRSTFSPVTLIVPSTIEPGVAPLAPASCADGPTRVAVVGPVMLTESPLPLSSRRNASAGVIVPTTAGAVTRDASADE
jgi:hypothetical protein